MFSYFSLRKVDMFIGITHVIGSNIKEVMRAGRKKVEGEKINYLFGVRNKENLSDWKLHIHFVFSWHSFATGWLYYPFLVIS